MNRLLIIKDDSIRGGFINDNGLGGYWHKNEDRMCHFDEVAQMEKEVSSYLKQGLKYVKCVHIVVDSIRIIVLVFQHVNNIEALQPIDAGLFQLDQPTAFANKYSIAIMLKNKCHCCKTDIADDVDISCHACSCAFYCSKDCMRMHLHRHKSFCKVVNYKNSSIQDFTYSRDSTCIQRSFKKKDVIDFDICAGDTIILKEIKPLTQPKYSDADLCAMFDSTPSTPLKSSKKSKSPKQFTPKPTFIDSAGVRRNLKNVV